MWLQGRPSLVRQPCSLSQVATARRFSRARSRCCGWSARYLRSRTTSTFEVAETGMDADQDLLEAGTTIDVAAELLELVAVQVAVPLLAGGPGRALGRLRPQPGGVGGTSTADPSTTATPSPSKSTGSARSTTPSEP